MNQVKDLQLPCFEKQLINNRNPFSKTIVKDAWDEVVDVESVNAHVSDYVFEMLKDIKDTNDSRIILALGQPGIGKSHLLARIRRRLEQQKDALFVQVRPIADPYNLMTNLYREIFVSLRKKWKTEDYSPLDYLVAHLTRRMFIEFLPKKYLNNSTIQKIQDILKKEPMAAFKLLEVSREEQKLRQEIFQQTLDFIAENHPDVELDYVKALIKSMYPETKGLAYRWLQGDELDDDELQKLGVKKMVDSEDNAFKFIISLTKLSPFPMLLCFDQLESLYDRTGDEQVITAFFDLLVSLHNHVPNLGIILMIQITTWEQMKNLVQESAKDRIESIFSLKNPTQEEIEEMVALRLKPLWEKCPNEEPPFPTYPFTREYLKTVAVSVGYNPRHVLKALAQEVNEFKQEQQVKVLEDEAARKSLKETQQTTITPQDIDAFLMDRVRDFIESSNQNSEAYTPSAMENFIKDAFLDVFNYLKNETIPFGSHRVVDVSLGKESVRDEPHILINFLNDKTNEKIVLGVMSVNTENGRSFHSKVSRLERGLKNKKFDKWVILRHHQLEIKPTWKKSQEVLNSILVAGRVLYVEDEDADVLIALKELLDAAGAGDLTFNGKTMTRSNVLRFFESKILPTLEIINEMQSIIDKEHAQKGSEPSISFDDTSHEDLVEPIQDEKLTITEDEQSHELLNQILGLLDKVPVLASQKMATSLNVPHENVKKALTILRDQEKINILHESENSLVVSKKPDENII